MTQGQFAGIGSVHFSDREHLIDLFSGFQMQVMEHKVVRKEIPRDEHVFASWNFVAAKAAGPLLEAADAHERV
jgi:hypothetical protein